MRLRSARNVPSRAYGISPRDTLSPMAQLSRSAEVYDVVVVGSGATGGWAAKELSEAGMKVALLEAGPKVAQKDYTEHLNTWQMPYLGMSPKVKDSRPIQGQCYACTEYN